MVSGARARPPLAKITLALRRLGLGSDAPADASGYRHPLLSPLPSRLPHRPPSGASTARARVGGLVRPRLLPSGPQPSPGGEDCGAKIRRAVPSRLRASSITPGRARLHCSRRFEHRLQPALRRDGWKRDSRGVSLESIPGKFQSTFLSPSGRTGARPAALATPAGELQPSANGTRPDRLPAARAALSRLPASRAVSRLRTRDS